MTNRVVKSYNNDAADHCVDIFMRGDGSFGFEEYRRDHEDLRGWFSLRRHSEETFKTERDAVVRAKATVAWLSGILARTGLRS